MINRSWTGSPASNNVRELVATNVDILAINEGAIADVTVASPNVSVLVVWSNDNVTISGDSDVSAVPSLVHGVVTPFACSLSPYR